MFVDEIEIEAKAGNGGDGVVRWRREKFKPKGGPAGGNGGNGGDVYVRAVRDLGLLAEYKGATTFTAENGEPGGSRSMHGKDGEDLYINVPVGATVVDTARDRKHVLMEEGEIAKILLGGQGGLGNEYFKSSTNQTPKQATKGKKGEGGRFYIELALLVDVGFVGLPNAGKSTLLNTLTNATAAVGAYPFTTLEPHLGDFYGFILADIPGLIQGASKGKGLGHKFLRHVRRTKMLLHCVSLEHENPLEEYKTIRAELANFDPALSEKTEWVVLTKKDLVSDERASDVATAFKGTLPNVLVVSAESKEGIKELGDALVHELRQTS